MSLTTHDDTDPSYASATRLYPNTGSIRYKRAITVSPQVAGQMRNGVAVIVVHGIDYNGNGVYDQNLGPNAEASAPALCGPLVPGQTTASTGRGQSAVYTAR